MYKFLNVCLGFVNVLLFGCLIFALNFTQITIEKSKCSFDAISVQIAIMDIVLTCVSLGIAAAGYIGYNVIKSSAVNNAQEKAIEKAEEVAQDMVSKRLNDLDLERYRPKSVIDDKGNMKPEQPTLMIPED